MYKVNPSTGIVTKISDGSIAEPIPLATEENYREYFNWLNGGNSPRVIPDKVTPRQIRLALNMLNLRSTIENAIKNSSQDIKDTWDFATEIDREDPLLKQFQIQLNLTDDMIDSLFETAYKF